MILSLLLSVALAQVSPSPTESPSSTPSPSATPRRSFTSPEGWQENRADADWDHVTSKGKSHFRVQVTPGGYMASETRAMLDALFLADGGATIHSRTSVELCEGAKGVLLDSDQQFTQGTMRVRTLFVNTSTAEYFTSYARPVSDVDDPRALTALNSLCPVPGASPIPVGAPPIRPPSNWMQGTTYAQDQSAGAIWVWVNAQDSQLVEVLGKPTPPEEVHAAGNLLGGFRNHLFRTFSDVTYVKTGHVTLCGHEGMYARFAAHMAKTPMGIDLVLYPDTPMSYAAMYVHRLKDPIDRGAVASVTSLCPNGVRK